MPHPTNLAADQVPAAAVNEEKSASASIPPERDLAGALHEVSNALTVVLGWIERARAGAADPVEVERALAIAASRASQARGIVRAAIGVEGAPEPRRPAGGVVADAVIGLEPELSRAKLSIRAEVATAVEAAPIADASVVLQILTNLLLNAIAASPAGSTVGVEARPGEGAEVVFAVTDEGPGVPPDRRHTVFHDGISTRPGGAGIGLRHAASLARAMGGDLCLSDSRRGARFELTWPTEALDADEVPAEISSRSVASSRPNALRGARILLLEDDDAVIDLLDTALTARGADVVSIRRHGELAGALASGPFDAALFDISPIQGDVRGALATVRASSGVPRLVLISGNAAQAPAVPPDWVSAWVRKPFEITEILAALGPRRKGVQRG